MWQAAIPFVANIASGLIGADGARRAGNLQADAGREALGVQRGIWDDTQQNINPFIGYGRGAGGRLADLLGTSGNIGSDGYGDLTRRFGVQDYLSGLDPSYELMRSIGERSLTNSQAASSGALSGAALRRLGQFNQDYAMTGYQGAFDRWRSQQGDIYSRLMGMTGQGQSAALGLGQIGMQTGANMGNLITGIGNARASSAVGQANAYSRMLTNLGGMGYGMAGGG